VRRRFAFTIIELLVVVTVIAVLISILLPAVNKIQMATGQTICLSNVRILTAGILAYTTDHDSQLPYCNWNNSVDDNSQYDKGWLFATAQYRVGYSPASVNGAWGGLPHYPSEGVVTGVIWPYINSYKPYHCPIDNPDFWTGTEWLTSYLFNGAECDYGSNYGNGYTSPGIQLRRVVSPRTKVVLWEALEQRFEGQSFTGAVWNDGSSYPSEEVLADRHYKGANVSFYDGHVEWWSATTWTNWVASGDFNPLTLNGHY
jgi:prepilin-type processing-associated H-X9-DG protein/prepilin-type N-terminal cleavage/methylation domain-containing protein